MSQFAGLLLCVVKFFMVKCFLIPIKGGIYPTFPHLSIPWKKKNHLMSSLYWSLIWLVKYTIKFVIFLWDVYGFFADLKAIPLHLNLSLDTQSYSCGADFVYIFWGRKYNKVIV